jgi:asparagine synthase (glutamine-hydrolysing)
MFAFFVTDGEHFVAARDPLGIKPLYFGYGHGGIWFASELKAIVGHCKFFEALPAGSSLTQQGRIHRWFSPRWADQVGQLDAPPGALEERLERAVVKRLMSDVEVGVFLSGGLDSSIIACLAQRNLSGLKTFAVGCEGSTDLVAARLVARALGTRHYEYVYSKEEAIKELSEVIYHLESYDAALIQSAVPCYFLSKLAREHVKVVLTGEGADEVFAGYDYFSDIWDAGELHQECVRLLFGLHGMNLQRVDRMTMAHGLEGRVPFLDMEFLDWAMSLDPRLKLRPAGRLEKRLLRTAFEGQLPPAILRRKKQEFSQGAGADLILSEYAASKVSTATFAGARSRFPIDTPATKEEFYYRAVFEDLFPGDSARASVHRWRRAPKRREPS